MFQVREITDTRLWDGFLCAQKHTPFVQSASYGDFYRSLGEKSWIYGVFEEDTLVAGSLAVSVHAKRGDFVYLPYGPTTVGSSKEALSLLFDRIHADAKKRGYHFVRTTPFWSDSEHVRGVLKNNGYKLAPMHILAETTWMLDITPSEDELLVGMNKNHRNLVRRCDREGVKIEMGKNQKMLDQFNDLHDETAKRHKFSRFSRDYIEKEFHAFAESDDAIIINAYLPDGTLDSSGIFMFFGSMSVYRHGASLMRDKKIPTSYAVQWAAIREAKKRDMKYHNFWGIAPDSAPKTHPFKGITHFKKGFGGQQLDLVPCHDKPLSVRYFLTWVIEYIRKIKRGF